VRRQSHVSGQGPILLSASDTWWMAAVNACGHTNLDSGGCRLTGNDRRQTD
jgi:hypothetical protein